MSPPLPNPQPPRSDLSPLRSAPVMSDAPGLETAFEALKSYDHGSSRGALLPIDQAVAGSSDRASTSAPLERRLVGFLRAGISAIAQDYVCSKLVLVGSEYSVPVLASLLADSRVSTAARNALQAIPGRRAAKALRQSLPKLKGSQKCGVIQSLGARRDADAVGGLSALLKDPDPEITGAAVAALGNVATIRAARILRDFESRAAGGLGLKLADAALNCAQRLQEAGRESEAALLYRMLTTSNYPLHVRNAALRGLKLVGTNA